VKPDSRYCIASRWLYGKTANRSFELDVDHGLLQFGLSSDGIKQFWVKSSTPVLTNSWTHMAAVSDGSTMRLYIDGKLDKSTAPAPSTIHESGTKIQLGQWYTSGSWLYLLKGRLDEIKI